MNITVTRDAACTFYKIKKSNKNFATMFTLAIDFMLRGRFTSLVQLNLSDRAALSFSCNSTHLWGMSGAVVGQGWPLWPL